MQDECLLQLHDVMSSEARRGFEVLSRQRTMTMEQLMQAGPLTTQQARKSLWGLAGTGLIVHQRGLPVRLSSNGERLVELLQSTVDR